MSLFVLSFVVHTEPYLGNKQRSSPVFVILLIAISFSIIYNR